MSNKRGYNVRIRSLAEHYLRLLLIFILQKPLFMIYTGGLDHDYSLTDWIKVIWHGLPVDLS
ncbi:hypothetical protein SMA90_32565, partial [Escherichia coli]